MLFGDYSGGDRKFFDSGFLTLMVTDKLKTQHLSLDILVSFRVSNPEKKI